MTDSPNTPPPRHNRWLGDLRLALMLLTRLPMPAGDAIAVPADGGMARAAWIFPMVGLLVGLAGGGVFMLAGSLGLGLSSAALLAMGTQILLTGALHEDGLADMADGFGGGHSRERKLDIMRDSRIGTYGVVALIIALALRFTALQDLASNLLSISDELEDTAGQNSAIIIALVAAGALSRAAMTVVWYLLPPARTDGLAAGSGAVPFSAAVTAVLLAAAIAFVVLPGFAFIVACATVAVLTMAVALLAHWQIRGHTGDVLGATQQITEIGALLAIGIATIAA
ncbi:MAG: adenosylcobinamide-GDP ribazoletransferase [Ferrovibrio sp.]|uniref:adenosylcobinamide-GDP ribazoletransferase n=1 Tax=Ferrovibrio sp. TaxID=1917215 RepID=UPI0026144066|nr:adenosylcobinamide-GDP ribazoletransferase [Ferrovibrio sp.]MCW0236493.1 adenosylcobinamide-GDP ribazoletransferase [Ferrovibrio sp.]